MFDGLIEVEQSVLKLSGLMEILKESVGDRPLPPDMVDHVAAFDGALRAYSELNDQQRTNDGISIAKNMAGNARVFAQRFLSQGKPGTEASNAAIELDQVARELVAKIDLDERFYRPLNSAPGTPSLFRTPAQGLTAESVKRDLESHARTFRESLQASEGKLADIDQRAASLRESVEIGRASCRERVL